MAILDVYSRKIISWDISTSMDESFCLRILQDSLKQAKPSYINTDQGSQFTGEAWIKTVTDARVKVSMDGKGRWADNIPVERFWRSVKYEWIFLKSFESVDDLFKELSDYMAFYNTKRPHQGLKYAVPIDVYQGLITAPVFEFKKAA